MYNKHIAVLISFLLFHFNGMSQEYRANTSRSWKWPSTTIKVSWVNPSSNNYTERKWVEEAIKQTWEKESGLTFTWVTNSENDFGIKIRIADEWPRTFGLGNQIARLPVGMVLNFDFYNWVPIRGGAHAQAVNRREFYIKVIAIHEFGHALGFAHEQARSDCYFCDEKQTGGEIEGDWYITTCDLNSVMNYCNPEYNNNGELSAGDIEGIRALYGYPKNKESSSSSNLTLSYTTNNGYDDGTIKVYLGGAYNAINDVKSVTYNLDNRFNPNKVTSKSLEDNFALKINLKNSITFSVTAEIEYKNGTTKEVQRAINYLKKDEIAEKPIERIACQHRITCNHRVTCSHTMNCQHKVTCSHTMTCQHKVACSHTIACQHRMTCQHTTYCTHRIACQHYYFHPYFGQQRQHQFDLMHNFDYVHNFDFQHNFDYVHSFDFQHNFDYVHNFDLQHNFDYVHNFDYAHDYDFQHTYDFK